MKIKRLKKIRVNSYIFNIEWDKEFGGAEFYYQTRVLKIGTKDASEAIILERLCHELWEVCAIELNIRYARTDCDGDYLFNYDHRQHTTMSEMFAGLLAQFLSIEDRSK